MNLEEIKARGEAAAVHEYDGITDLIYGRDVKALTAEVERLTAENAELKKSEIDSAGIEQIKKALGESVENIIAEHNRIMRSVKEENATLKKALELAMDRAMPNSSYSVKQAIMWNLIEQCERQQAQQTHGNETQMGSCYTCQKVSGCQHRRFEPNDYEPCAEYQPKGEEEK